MVLDGKTFVCSGSCKVVRLLIISAGVSDTNRWFADVASPEYDVGAVDAALDNFFSECFLAGLGKCPIWSPSGISSIQSLFFEADRRLQQNPIVVPEVGLFEFPQWRYAVYGALFIPSLLFQNLAKPAKEVHEGIPGDAIMAILRAQANSGMPAEPHLVDPNSQLINGDRKPVDYRVYRSRAPPKSRPSTCTTKCLRTVPSRE